MCTGKCSKFIAVALYVLATVSVICNIMLFFPGWDTEYAGDDSEDHPRLTPEVKYMGGLLGGGIMILIPAIHIHLTSSRDGCCANRCGMFLSIGFAAVGVAGAIYSVAVAAVGLANGPVCNFSFFPDVLPVWGRPFANNNGSYLENPDSWAFCREPENVVEFNVALFSTLLVTGSIAAVLCTIQMVNGLFGCICGTCGKEQRRRGQRQTDSQGRGRETHAVCGESASKNFRLYIYIYTSSSSSPGPSFLLRSPQVKRPRTMPMSNATPTSCDSNGTHNSTGEVAGVFVAVYGATTAVGLVFNLTALVVFCRVNSKSRSHTTVYMTNLAAADLVLVLALPVRIYYHLGFHPHQRLCEWAGLVLLVNMYGSIFLLMCICLDRCMAVTFPMSVRVRDARKKSPLVCLGIWVFTFGASLPSYLLQDRTVSSKLDCFGSLPVYTYTHPGIVFSTLTIGFGIPLSVMLACSWGLFRAIRRSAVAQTDLVNSRKINRMIGVSLFIFLLSFLPYHAVLGLLYLYRADVPCPLLGAYRYSLMLACLNAMLDPVAYYFTTETFRKRMDLDAVRTKFQLNSHSSVQGHNNKTEAPINT